MLARVVPETREPPTVVPHNQSHRQGRVQCLNYLADGMKLAPTGILTYQDTGSEFRNGTQCALYAGPHLQPALGYTSESPASATQGGLYELSQVLGRIWLLQEGRDAL
jgi:hypothetical protein